MPTPPLQPRHFFLNEQHELSPEEKGGGGSMTQVLNVNWTQKADRLAGSLDRVERRAVASRDPVSRRRYYILAEPVSQIVRASKAKDAVGGQKSEGVDFAGEQSKVFARLGLDLVEVHANGSATVHALPERFEQLRARAAELGQASERDQARWVSLETFDWLPADLKFDHAWLSEIGTKPIEAHIKLQPLLSALEADSVIRAIGEILSAHSGCELRGKGNTYLGRVWLRAVLKASAIKALANEFASIQSIHPPIIARADGSADETRERIAPSRTPTISAAPSTLPCVAVVDTAVPDEHLMLQPYRRGTVVGRDCLNTANDHHGSCVASRIVFGELDFAEGEIASPAASCTFYEVRVAESANTIRAESVPTALATVTSAAPDVRVFNLSFDSRRALADMTPKYRAETLKLIEDLDNFAFDQDVLLVIAAGNAPFGVIPDPRYPRHLDHPNWMLGSFPRCFNALTCGGTIPRIAASGLADEPNAPSPFARLGPGFAESPKPDFCAPAGNTDANYQKQPGLGVWGYSALGEPLEVFGTSHAAPLLAREAAMTLHELRKVCPPETLPFACTAKAILALTATDVTSALSRTLQPLAKRALGHYGRATSGPLRLPTHAAAMFFWQGVIEHHKDILRVQLPVPREWLRAATQPELRICVAWDVPVNAAVEHCWSCRDIALTLRMDEDTEAASGSRGRRAGYPLFQRHWDLGKLHSKAKPRSDLWVAEFRYEQIAAYAAGHIVSPIQRIAFAAELRDCGEKPSSPQQFVQQLPIAATLNRFSVTAVPFRQPVVVTSEI